MHEAKKLAQLATDLYLMKIIERWPLADSASNPRRKEMFTPLLYRKAVGTAYYQTLLTLIDNDDCPSEELTRRLHGLFQQAEDNSDKPMPDTDRSEDENDSNEEKAEEYEDDDHETEEDGEKEGEYEHAQEGKINTQVHDITEDQASTSQVSAKVIKQKYQNAGRPQVCALVAFKLLKDCYPNFSPSKAISGRNIQMLSQTLDQELASHLKGRIPLLVEKV
jgi:hypothetical protein